MQRASTFSKEEISCHDRLIEAARIVIAREGVRGATTRQIAREAGVNEVTLFRHFGNKVKLVLEVMLRSAEAQMGALSGEELDLLGLKAGLHRYAKLYDEVITSEEPLIRTVIGEANRDPDCARQVSHEAIEPWRRRLRAFLEAKQQIGEVRPDLDIAVAVDHFTGMLLGGMLRRTCPWRSRDYSQTEYVETSVDIFLRGIEFLPKPASN